MRALSILKAAFASLGAAALSSCLVSEDPVLDDRTGKATPLAAGDYTMCPVSDDADADDCERTRLTISDNKVNIFTPVDDDGEIDDDDQAMMRMRRIGRKGYAVQSEEDGDYLYYYGAGDSEAFRLTMMMCEELPEGLRERLIERGDLEAEDDDFETCIVKTRRGLTDAALAYHRGQVESEEPIMLSLTPAPALAMAQDSNKASIDE